MVGPVSVTIEGVRELQARLGEAAAKAIVATSAALYGEANTIFSESQRIVPVDTGALRDSGQVTTPVVSGVTVEVEIGYGGPAAPYALYVHEIPPPPAKSSGGRSATHNPPTAWKYLEGPFMAAMATMETRLGGAIAGEFRI